MNDDWPYWVALAAAWAIAAVVIVIRVRHDRRK